MQCIRQSPLAHTPKISNALDRTEIICRKLFSVYFMQQCCKYNYGYPYCTIIMLNKKNIDKKARFKAELGRLPSTRLKKMCWL